MLKHRYILAAFFLLAVLAHWGETAAQARFRTVPVGSQVRQGALNCIHQDRRGMLWLGTASGLYTYDGISFHSFMMADAGKDNGPSALFTDSAGNLWIGLENGSVIRHRGFGIIDTLLTGGRDNNSRITGFVEQQPGTIWIASYGSGLFLSRDDGISELNSASGLSDDYIYTMIKGPDGRVWVGTDNGITIADHANGSWEVKILSIGDGLPDFIVQSLAVDDLGHVWVGMYDKGICRYDPSEGSFYVPDGLESWEQGAVRDMLWMQGCIWIATSDRGIMEYNLETGSLEEMGSPRDEGPLRIRSMLRDREGNVWLLSANELIYSFGSTIEFFERLGGKALENIHALAVDRDDRLWFADDTGLYSYDPTVAGSDPTYYPLDIDLKMQKVMSIFHDVFGFVWIGTFGSGLVRLDPASGTQVVITERDGLVNGNVLSIAGNDREIWFGTLGGASRCLVEKSMKDPDHLPRFRNFGAEEGLVNNYIYQVYLSENGTPYLATDGNGVQVYREERFESLDPRNEFTDQVVYSVTTDSRGNTWLNVAGEGVYQYDDSSYSMVSRNTGQGDMTCSGIQNNGIELVMAYENGIDVMNILTGSIRHYEENAGIPFINPDLNTLSRDGHDNVWIGTSSGIVKVRPLEGGFWEHPKIILEEVSLFLEPFDYHLRNEFAHDENHLSFNYSGLWYQQPEQVEYLVKLEGHDLGWMPTRNNQVVYSDLRPGNYTFRVRAGIFGNFSSGDEATYTFLVSKPYYASAWFYILAALAAGGVVALILTIRVRQVKKKEELVQEKIRFQFENLKSQINPHFLFNSFSTLIALIEDDSGEAVKYVEELSMLFRNILEYKDQELVSVDREFEIVGHYINLQKKRFGRNLVVEMEPPSSFQGARIPPLTLQLLIENAIKHNVVSKDKPLTINIFSKPGENRIFVENNIQEKLKDTPSTGVGINNIISRYKLLTNKEVFINKTATTFTVGLPLIP